MDTGLPRCSGGFLVFFNVLVVQNDDSCLLHESCWWTLLKVAIGTLNISSIHVSPAICQLAHIN